MNQVRICRNTQADVKSLPTQTISTYKRIGRIERARRFQAKVCAASLRVRIVSRRLDGSTSVLLVWRDSDVSTRMKLRAYRKYSIKLMLAWGTCCRFSPFLHPVMKMADDRTCLITNSSWIRNLVLLPGDIYYCWGAGLGGLHALVLSPSSGLWLFGPYHQKKVSGGVRSH